MSNGYGRLLMRYLPDLFHSLLAFVRIFVEYLNTFNEHVPITLNVNYKVKTTQIDY